MSFSFFLKKRFYIPAIIVLIVGFFSYRHYQSTHQPPVYETVAATRGNVAQTVEATGNLEAIDDLSLRFELPGLLSKVNVKEGDMVVSGTVLGNLRLSELDAAVAQASANLNQRLAGATVQDRSYAEAAVSSAQASLDQTKLDTAKAISDAQSALATAQNNLRLAQNGNDSQIVTQAYENAVAALQAALPKLDDALTQADNILGVDNTVGNSSYQQYLSASNPSVLSQARLNYTTTKAARDSARSLGAPLTSKSRQIDIDAGLDEVAKALSSMLGLLGNTSDVLSNTTQGGSLTQATLDGLKTIIQATRTTISTQNTAIVTTKQNLVNAKNSLVTFQIAYTSAVRNLTDAEANADASIKIRQATYDQAVSNLQTKINPPRAVDIAYYRAALSQAIANREKAYIRAPISGQITKVGKKPGELVTSADQIFKLLSPHYEIQVDVSEVDVPKIKIDDQATITLNGFGPDVLFTGEIVAIDPAATVIQDVVYYKVRIRLDDTTKPVKSGMTANVSIATDRRDNVLFVPFRTIHSRDDGSKFVRVLSNGQEQEVDVKVGLRGNEGKTEVSSTLKEGDAVIVSKK
jgi:HlyD family secretion protein